MSIQPTLMGTTNANSITHLSVHKQCFHTEQQKCNTYFQQHVCNAIIDKDTRTPLEYRQLIKRTKYKDIWATSFASKLGQLAQGIQDVEGTGHIVVDYSPQKLEPNCTRLTIGGDCIDYPWKVTMPTDDLTTAKLLFNSTISTTREKFFGVDVKNFYLNTPLDQYEYMQLPLDLIPEEISLKYSLQSITENGWVCIEIEKRMYGLPQTGLLAIKLLTQRLATPSFYPCHFTPGL